MARWQWQRVDGVCTQFKTKHQIKHQPVLPAIYNFNKCVSGFYLYWKVWHKSEKEFGMCSECHDTTRGLVMETRQLALGGSSCLHPPNPSLCNAILNICPYLLASRYINAWYRHEKEILMNYNIDATFMLERSQYIPGWWSDVGISRLGHPKMADAFPGKQLLGRSSPSIRHRHSPWLNITCLLFGMDSDNQIWLIRCA